MKYIKLFEEYYDDLSNLKTFKSRKDYMSNKEILGKGTGRIVYDIGDNVIKLAKNKKGVAQNIIESNPSIKNKYGNIVSSVLDYDKDGKWLIQEKVDLINEDFFNKWLSMEYEKDIDMDSFFYWIRLNNKSLKDFYTSTQFGLLIDNFINEYNLDRFDISNISSWGVKNGKPVIIDYGMNVEVARKLYGALY